MWVGTGEKIVTGTRGTSLVTACMTANEADAIWADIEKMITETGFCTPLLGKFLEGIAKASNGIEKNRG